MVFRHDGGTNLKPMILNTHTKTNKTKLSACHRIGILSKRVYPHLDTLKGGSGAKDMP